MLLNHWRATSSTGCYDNALTVLRGDTRDWWKEKLTWESDDYDEGEAPYTPDVSGLLRFLQSEVSSWYETRRRELANRPLIQSQAFGEALAPHRLDKLARYETHLDRKLERTLAMLLTGLPQHCELLLSLRS